MAKGNPTVRGVAAKDILNHVECWKVYGLVDPRNGQVKYIGTTRQPLNMRVSQHIYETRNKTRGGRKKRAWVQRLLDLGLRPIIIELDRYVGRYVDIDVEYKVGMLERRWIAHYRRKGYKLTNESAGGPGASHRQRVEDRARRAASMRAYREAQRKQQQQQQQQNITTPTTPLTSS